jgi:hypothetical protein
MHKIIYNIMDVLKIHWKSVSLKVSSEQRFCTAGKEQFEVWSCTILRSNFDDGFGLAKNNNNKVKAVKNPSHCTLILQSVPALTLG